MTAKKKYLKKKNSAFKVPSWAKGWFEVPDRVYFNQVAYRHGAFAILSVALPSAVTGLMFFGGATCMANMMNRCVEQSPGAQPCRRGRQQRPPRARITAAWRRVPLLGVSPTLQLRPP